MRFNLRVRSLDTVQDYTPSEFRYLLDLARDLKRAKCTRTEQQHLSGKEICLILDKTSIHTRCAIEVACHDQGAHGDLSGSVRIAHRPYGIVQGHRPRARTDVDAISIAAPAERVSRRSPKPPACRFSTA